MLTTKYKSAQNRWRYKPRHQPLSEINVTPMVDVMLVLLVVFMVAAPLLSVGVSVNLPKAQAQALKSDEKPLTVSVNAAGDIFIEESAIALDDLIGRLRAIFEASENAYDRRIYVRGDAAVAYGRMAAVVAAINTAGFRRVALVTEKPARAEKVR